MTEVNAELIAHMSDPKNYGAMDQPDAMGIGENPQNGEKVIIYLRVTDTEGVPLIEDIRFQAIGCMTTVVAGSVVTQEAKGLDFPTADQLVGATLGMLENVPPEEAACSEMVALSLQAALDTYRNKQKDHDFGTITYQIENSCTIEENA
jgi:nitrogen fixation NifU-like protein